MDVRWFPLFTNYSFAEDEAVATGQAATIESKNNRELVVAENVDDQQSVNEIVDNDSLEAEQSVFPAPPAAPAHAEQAAPLPPVPESESSEIVDALDRREETNATEDFF